MSVFTLKEIQQKLELFQANWKHQEQELILFLKLSSYQSCQMDFFKVIVLGDLKNVSFTIWIHC